MRENPDFFVGGPNVAVWGDSRCEGAAYITQELNPSVLDKWRDTLPKDAKDANKVAPNRRSIMRIISLSTVLFRVRYGEGPLSQAGNRGPFLESARCEVRGATVDVGHGTMNGTPAAFRVRRPAGLTSLSQSCSHSSAARYWIAWATWWPPNR